MLILWTLILQTLILPTRILQTLFLQGLHFDQILLGADAVQGLLLQEVLQGLELESAQERCRDVKAGDRPAERHGDRRPLTTPSRPITLSCRTSPSRR